MPASDRADPAAPPLDGRPRGLSRGIVLALLAITAVSVLLRCTGAGFMLPHVAQVDERVIYYQVGAERGIDPPEAKLTSLDAYPTLLARGLHVVMGSPADCTARTTEEHAECAALELARMRTWLALFAALGVPMLFFLARRFVSDPVALLATGFFALSILHGWFSPQARPHAALCTLAVPAILACVELRRRGDARAYLMAGALAALACATLQSGFFVLPALVLAHLLRRRSQPGRRAWPWFAVACAIVAAAVLLFYRRGEATVSGPSITEDPVAWLMGRIHKFDSHMFNGRGFEGLYHAVVDYEPVLGLLSLVGLVVLLARATRRDPPIGSDRVRDVLVLAAYPITHVVAFGLYQDTFQRFLIPVIPWMCLLAAIGLASAARGIGRLAGSNGPRWIVTAVVVLLALAPQAWVAVRIVRLRLAPDTLTRAAAWIEANVEREHERVAVVPTLDLPLIRPLELVPLRRIHGPLNFSPWTDHQIALAPEQRDPLAWSLFQVPLFSQQQRERMKADPDAFVRALDAQYLVLEVTHGFRFGILEFLRDGARRQGRLVARFGSREPANEEDLPILYELNGPYAADEHFAWRAARFTSQGPDVEIYALPR